ncbi:MAG: hypothetical protein MR908_01825 [Firmicutes bacterium]|nr:hypothetical protein [Bacillota bacterium]
MISTSRVKNSVTGFSAKDRLEAQGKSSKNFKSTTEQINFTATDDALI